MQPTIKDLILASFPCLLFDTVDWENAIRKIRKALIEVDDAEVRVREDGKVTPSFCIWTITEGVVQYSLRLIIDPKTGREIPPRGISSARTFVQALEYVKNEDSVAMILMNPRQYLQQAQNIQQLIDSSTAARLKYSNIFIVGPGISATLAPELSNIVYEVDFPLPDKKELLRICLDEVVLPNLENISLDVPDLEGKDEHEEIRNAVYKSNKELFDAVAKAASGLDSHMAENAFSLSLVMSDKLDPLVIQEQKRQAIQNTEVLEYIPCDETMDDIGGFDNYREWLSIRTGAFSEEAIAFGVSQPKGVLFAGPSGSGKSLAAKATASELQVPLLRFDMSQVFHHLVGSSEERMRRALNISEAVAPVVLWLDRFLSRVKDVNSVKLLTGNAEDNTEPSPFVRWEGVETIPSGSRA